MTDIRGSFRVPSRVGPDDGYVHGRRGGRSNVDSYDLDDVDRRLLTLLQENSRYTAIELADRIGVSDNTVHNRMSRLEEAEVISGYAATIDHDRAGLRLHFMFICTARISERGDVAERALEIPAVVDVTELMTGQRNLHVTVFGTEDEDITQVARRLDGLELEVEDETLVRTQHATPLDYVEIEDVLAQ